MLTTQDLKCPKCGSSILATSRVCSHCGTILALSRGGTKFVDARLTCPNCQADNSRGDLFCRECNAPLTKVCFACNIAMPMTATHCDVCGRSHEETLHSRKKQLMGDRQRLVRERDQVVESRRAITNYVEGHRATIRIRREKINKLFTWTALGTVALLTVAVALPIPRDAVRWIGLALFSACGLMGAYSVIDAVCGETSNLEQEVIRYQFELYSLAEQEKVIGRRTEANSQQLGKLTRGTGPRGVVWGSNWSRSDLEA